MRIQLKAGVKQKQIMDFDGNKMHLIDQLIMKTF